MPDMDKLPSDGITVLAASRILDVNRRQVLRLIDRGKLRRVKQLPGTSRAPWILSKAEVEALKAEQAS